jgi:thiol-disulfide isomerase/thioredoxin
MAKNDKGKNNASSGTVATLIISVVVVILGVYAITRVHGTSQVALNPNDPKVVLAQCLTDNGAKMYGASWCPHCAAQKKDFGDAFEKVTYVECAIPGDPQDQTQPCKDAKIVGYPTWVFADGSRVSGEQTLEDLAAKAGCSYGAAQPGAGTNANAPAILEMNTNTPAAIAPSVNSAAK